MNYEAISGRVKREVILFIHPIIDFFVKLELNPNWFTSLSLLICLVSSYFFAVGSLRIGGALLLIGSAFDMIDGAVARAANRVTKFGALYDSTLDRYSEIIVFFGMTFHFVAQHELGYTTSLLVPVVVLVALAGSLMVSYVRARAESLGFECKVGLMQRPERIVLIGLGALVHEYVLIAAIFIVAALANYTAIQRIRAVWVMANSAEKSERLPQTLDHE